MDYVDGQPIDAYCDQHQLTVEDRLKLFRTVCDAVEHAHQNRIVHRDLKPSNILVTADGGPRLLDFGIAKLLSPELSPEMGFMTTAGIHHMTLAYASPEQVQGNAITYASDVYSLGVVLYELLTGHRPYRFKNYSQAEVERVICETEAARPSTIVTRTESDQEPEGPRGHILSPEVVSRARGVPLERLRRRLKGDLDNIVLKALHKEPQRRYSSAREFAEDIARHLDDRPVKARPNTLQYRARKLLRRRKAELAAFALLLVLATGWSYSLWRQARVNQGKNSLASASSVVQGDGPIRSIAVLPLRNFSKDATQEQFANGVTEQLMTELSHVDGLRIASRQSVLGYRNSGKPATEIARELNVDALVSGSVERAGERMRLAVRMTDGVHDKSLWSKDYESDNRDAPALQGAVAAIIAEEIRPKITGQPVASLRSSQPVNPKAQELLKKADDQRSDHEIWLLYRKSGSRKKANAEYAKSISYLERAIREDPNYAPAYVALADQIISYPPPDVVRAPKVSAALDKALALDETNPTAHLLKARCLWREDDRTRTLDHYKRAIQLRPDLPEYHEAYAEHLDAMGRFEDAMKQHQMAQALDPNTDYLSSSPLTPFPVRLDRTRRFMQSKMSNSNGAAGFWMRGELEYEAGQYAETVRDWAEAVRFFGWNEEAVAIEEAYAEGGPHALIQDAMRFLDTVAKDHWMLRSMLINAHRYAGDRSGALAWLETAARECQDNWAEVCDSGVLVQLKSDYHWDPYRSDPRFQAIVRQVEIGWAH
jgi:serine/threonine protein kinase